ncbi:hypothetical protein PBY51_010195 [Eleginops maclovinus]|uniref:Uncharacterized protein n=1 Tax=Eleginops maclovinus TaxID=56733 RepID=A0AAN7XC57_ELEMC|nr:hypothetical protein PBY51_010195 [Eleginops maclovinus]
MTEERNAFQLEKDIEKERRAFMKEMAMTREVYIKEKSDIQRMRVAFQSEKLHGKRKRNLQQRSQRPFKLKMMLWLMKGSPSR